MAAPYRGTRIGFGTWTDENGDVLNAKTGVAVDERKVVTTVASSTERGPEIAIESTDRNVVRYQANVELAIRAVQYRNSPPLSDPKPAKSKVRRVRA